MTIVSNGSASWPAINANRFYSYFVVAAFVVVTYDWALTFGQERQRWSLVTFLYLIVRYLGILFAALEILIDVLTISLTDTFTAVPFSSGCWILSIAWNWTGIAVFAILWIIIITRLYAMYQRSRKIVIFLIVAFLVNTIFIGVVAILITAHASVEEFILSGTYQCLIGYLPLLIAVMWILTTVWEVFTLCLAVWIAVKHFRELRRHSTGGIMKDCFTVLMKTHLLYFASFVAVSCLQLVIPTSSSTEYSLDIHIYYGFLRILEVVQMFVLGPRLILGVREFNAKLVADSDAATCMTSIAFQERVHISTGNTVSDIDNVSTNILDTPTVPTKESGVLNGKVEE
ncbi:uncharacterized protein EDB93DRAFT_1105799 [Suillus bovinus]|uniref:uncharacterized protein n=1 Tax=Suillus bovinus TaxID=48563 RepID=UPI001B8770BA|nr:uncharacterized protein EDB93DRAFT_1105799 [Suillus bovinus]KAG2141203.1 hypothetical protein EDB93DRAFT_1105799 [Suillus bovinus]